MVRCLIVACTVVFVFTTSAQGETYEWLDEKGVVHFTDTLDNVPRKYRKHVKVRASVTGEERPAATAPPPEKQPIEPRVSVKEEQRYGGHDMTWWQTTYGSLYDEIKNIQDNLPAKRERLATLRHKRIVYQKGSDRVSYNELNAEIERDEARIKELQQKVIELDAEASRAGVPSGWRQ